MMLYCLLVLDGSWGVFLLLIYELNFLQYMHQSMYCTSGCIVGACMHACSCKYLLNYSTNCPYNLKRSSD